MKKIELGLRAIIFAGLLCGVAAAQTSTQPTGSLGDYARSVRKQGQSQKAADAKRYDNDNLPQSEKISVVGQKPSETAGNMNNDANTANGASAADTAKDASGERKDDLSPEAKQAEYSSWKDQIQDQKKQIELASRELDVLQREYQLRAAAMYADAGNRLRNAGTWDKEDADYKAKIADKQKAVDSGKQKLEDMQEQARKAGVPASMRE